MPRHEMHSPRSDPRLAHRQGTTTLTLVDPRGNPMAAEVVEVVQTRQAFGFGNIGFDFVPLANDEGSESERERLTALAGDWLDVFNLCTLPFYWAQFEPVRGRPDTERLRNGARWFGDRGVRVKGHPLAWHTLAPDWLLDEPLAEVERLLRERIRREVAGFAGLVDTWDAVNEAVIMPDFTAEENAITRLCRHLGRIGLIRLAFEEARQANPGVTLHLNDFDLSPAYARLLEGVLEAGIGIDGLGLQTHMHQGYRGEEETAAILERFSRYGLPLHFTETTLVSGRLMPADIVDLNDYVTTDWPSTPEGEERKAEEVERHYRTLFAHPAVSSVTYWGLSDVGAWLNAPAGLIRPDGSRKPAFEVLRRLVREEWWTPPLRTRSDASGRCEVSGWRGDYEVRLAGSTAAFTIDEAAGSATVAL